MWIKICANTTLEDARLAADAGADAVGYVFAPSKRQVTAEQIAQIVPSVPPEPTQIGVFPASDFEEIAGAVRSTGLHGIQLHGAFDPQLVERLRGEFGYGYFLIQTLHWQVDGDPVESEKGLREELRAVARHGIVDAVLIDARTATASGGTGQTFDWKRAQGVVSGEAGKLRVILAGGLTPENVGEAIRTLRPWGVDVASGVEANLGRKDPARVRAFITAARAAFAAVENVTPLTAQLI